jgi:glycosyltransferase involved in cell wall biosynthesis
LTGNYLSIGPFIEAFERESAHRAGVHYAVGVNSGTSGLHLAALAALVERTNLRAADQVVVVSQPLQAQLVALGVPSDKVLVNPNGVDPSHFAPVNGGIAQRAHLGLRSTVTICFSGTFGVWHGIPVLAAAIPRVLAARPHARFLLLGEGPLRHLVDGLGERVLMPGLVPHATVPEYLAAADILVSPHGRQIDGGEFFGSPTKLYEYMAAGRPIVASGIGQIGQVLEHESTALLVPPDDPDALCAALVRLIDDPCLRVRLGEQARQRALAQHTWRHNADRLLAALGQ